MSYLNMNSKFFMFTDKKIDVLKLS